MPAVTVLRSQSVASVPAPVFFARVEESLISAGGSTSSPTYTLPDVVMPGELLLAFVSTDGAGETVAFPAASPEADGWIVLESGESTAPNDACSMAIFYRIADGSEDGAAVAAAIGSTEESVCAFYVISQWEGIEISDPAGSAGTTVHAPPMLSVPVNQYLWLAACANDTTTSGSHPADYPDNRSNGSSGGTFGCRIRVATKEKTGTEDQPGDFTTSNNRDCELRTLAVGPGPAQLPETALEVLNPGADADLSNWTDILGGIGRRTTNPAPFEGAAYFYGGTSATSRAYQDVAIPGALHGAVDAGRVAAVLEWYQNSFSGSDDGDMWIEFYDDGSPEAQLGTTRQAGILAPTVWTHRRLRHKAPNGARTVRIYMNMERDSGTNNDAYIDAISLKLVDYS